MATSLANIEEKLDVIINNQTQLGVKQEEMSRRLENVEGAVSALDKTVRGTNGSPGLVSSVNVHTTKLDRLAMDVEDLRKDDNDEKGKDGDDDGITWKWLVSELMLPVGLGFLAYVLFQVLPSILRHLGNVAP